MRLGSSFYALCSPSLACTDDRQQPKEGLRLQRCNRNKYLQDMYTVTVYNKFFMVAEARQRPTQCLEDRLDRQ